MLPIVPKAEGNPIRDIRGTAEWLSKKGVHGFEKSNHIYAYSETGVGNEISEYYFYRVSKNDWVENTQLTDTTY